MQQVAVSRGRRNVRYEGRQREDELVEKKWELNKDQRTRGSKSCSYLETSQAKGTERTDALRWEHAQEPAHEQNSEEASDVSGAAKGGKGEGVRSHSRDCFWGREVRPLEVLSTTPDFSSEGCGGREAVGCIQNMNILVDRGTGIEQYGDIDPGEQGPL